MDQNNNPYVYCYAHLTQHVYTNVYVGQHQVIPNIYHPQSNLITYYNGAYYYQQLNVSQTVQQVQSYQIEIVQHGTQYQRLEVIRQPEQEIQQNYRIELERLPEQQIEQHERSELEQDVEQPLVEEEIQLMQLPGQLDQNVQGIQQPVQEIQENEGINADQHPEQQVEQHDRSERGQHAEQPLAQEECELNQQWVIDFMEEHRRRVMEEEAERRQRTRFSANDSATNIDNIRRRLRESARLSSSTGIRFVSCKFCHNNRDNYPYYRTHDTHDEHGRVVCPFLRLVVCPICHATGDNAHTRKFCPRISRLRSTVAQ